MNDPDDRTISSIGPVWRELWGRVWHLTRPDRFLHILDDRLLKPEPDIPDNERWGTGLGPSHYPYVRSISGVSLFDFRDFNPDSYQEEYTQSNWYSFVPFPKHWAGAVWIEFDPEDVKGNFISGSQLVADWKSSASYCRKIMPHIEAAHIGLLPLDLARRFIFIRQRDDGDFYSWENQIFDRTAYEALQSEWKEDYDIARKSI